MARVFSSVHEAMEYVAFGSAGPRFSEVIFEEVEAIQVKHALDTRLDDPSVSDEIKAELRGRLAAQKCFRFIRPQDGKVITVVIGPFSDGYECWLVREDGLAACL